MPVFSFPYALIRKLDWDVNEMADLYVMAYGQYLRIMKRCQSKLVDWFDVISCH
jgi:hypothetical protein